MEGAVEQTYTQRLVIKSSYTGQVTLHIEPWAEELEMAPGASYQVLAEGPLGGCLEIQFAEKNITIYGWPASVVSVFEGQKAMRECLIPAPPLRGTRP